MPWLEPDFRQDMIVAHKKHSSFVAEEREKRKAARQARLERNLLIRRRKAQAQQMLEKQKEKEKERRGRSKGGEGEGEGE